MKKKRDITIKLSNKLFYTLIVIGILAVVGVGVWALGSVPNPGHSIGELETCEEGESLQVVDGEWDCVSGVSSSGFTKVSAYKSSSQTFTAINRKVIFEAEKYDTNNEFSSSRFVAKEAGYYGIHAQILAQELGELKNWVINIQHNSQSIAQTQYVSPGAGEYFNPTLDVQKIYYLDEGDWIEIEAFHTQVNDRIIFAGEENTYIEIYRIN